MERKDVIYIGDYPIRLLCDEHAGIVKPGGELSLSEKTILELGWDWKLVEKTKKQKKGVEQ